MTTSVNHFVSTRLSPVRQQLRGSRVRLRLQGPTSEIDNKVRTECYMKTLFNWVYAFIIGGAFGYSGYRILIGLPLPATSRSKNQLAHQVEVFLLEKLGPEILGTAFIVVGLSAALYIVRPKKAAADIRGPQ